MRIDITNGFVEIRDAMNRKARKAYLEALYFGVKVDPNQLTNPERAAIKFPIINIRRAQDALTSHLVTRIVVDGLMVNDPISYMDEEMSEADYDKVARECQKLDKPEAEEEKKTGLSARLSAGDAALPPASPKK